MVKFMGVIDVDKLLHFSLSGMLFLFFSGVSHNIWIGASIAFVIGLIKEIADYYFKGCASMRDIVANILGITWAMIFTVMI